MEQQISNHMKDTQVSAALLAKNWGALEYLVRAGYQLEITDNVMHGVPINWTGKYGEMYNFLLSEPCIRNTKEIKEIMECMGNREAVQELTSYITSVENKMLMLMSLYAITAANSFVGYEAIAISGGFSILATALCKHANNFSEFFSNLYITLDHRVTSKFKCNFTFNAKVSPADISATSRIEDYLENRQVELT